MEQELKAEKPGNGPKDRTIRFIVDGEELVTDQDALTVRDILTLSGNTPAEEYFLLEYRGQHEQYRHDALDEVIRLHNGIRFSAAYRGATPVS